MGRIKTLASRSPVPFLVLGYDDKTGLINSKINMSAVAQPGMWGIYLADVIAHLMRAYTQLGKDPETARREILKVFAQDIRTSPRPEGGPSTIQPLVTVWLDSKRHAHYALYPSMMPNAGNWGNLLVDAVNHITNAYKLRGSRNPAAVRAEIIDLFYKELERPTDKHTGGMLEGEES